MFHNKDGTIFAYERRSNRYKFNKVILLCNKNNTIFFTKFALYKNT